MTDRLRVNGLERRSIAGNRCEAAGLHHPACPLDDGKRGHMVIHHVYRRGHTPPGVDRDHVDNLRLVWNGDTGMGAGGCHGRIHQRVDQAAELGLLWVNKSYCQTCGARSGNTHWKGCPNGLST